MSRRLPRTVIALGVVSLLTDLSSEMIYPLIPAFLVTVLGAGAVALGTIEGVAEATASLLKVLSGRRTDRSGRRKPLVLTGYSISSVARPLMGIAGSWPVVAFFRFGDRIGKGVRTSPRDALIADSVDADLRGRAFGLHRSMDHAGAVLGPLVAAALISLAGWEIRHVIWFAAIPGVAVVVVLLLAVREPVHAPPVAANSESDGKLPAEYVALLVSIVVFTLGNSTDAFFLLRFTEAGIPLGAVAVLWAAHNSVKMATTWLSGRLTDRVGRRPLVRAGWLVYAVVYLIFGLVTSGWGLVTTFILYGLVFGLTEPAERAWVADLAPGDRRGTAFGWYHGAVGAAALPASIGFGVLYAAFGPAVAFGTGAVLALLALALLGRVKPVLA